MDGPHGTDLDAPCASPAIQIDTDAIDPQETEDFLRSVLADLEGHAEESQPSEAPLTPLYPTLPQDDLDPFVSDEPRVQSVDEAKSSKKSYRCRRCGQLRRGHTCVGYVDADERRKRQRPGGREEERRAGFFIQLVLLWWNKLKGMRQCGVVQ